MQRELVDIWKNIIEDLKSGSLSYAIVREFLLDLKKEFGGEDNKTLKVVELKRLEQGNKMMEEFVQKFRRVAKRNGYKERLLIEEFKREIIRMIRRKLMEAKQSLRSIEQ